MKNKIIIALLALFSFSAIAQKASIKDQRFVLNFDVKDEFKDFKTFSYTIQDDGKYWNHNFDSNTIVDDLRKPLEIEGLTEVKENADLQIVASFIGTPIYNDNGYRMAGDYNVLFLDKNNRLIKQLSGKITIITDYNYVPAKTRREMNIAKAALVTRFIHDDLLSEFQHAITGKAVLNLPTGLFRKVKGGHAQEYNEKSQAFIDKMVTNPNDTANLDAAITYWTSELNVDFGKKVKDKLKRKVIYANLGTANVLKKDTEEVKRIIEEAKAVSGLLGIYHLKLKKTLKLNEAIKETTITDKVINLTPKYLYVIAVEGPGTFYNKNKEIRFTNIEIDRIDPVELSKGIANLNVKKTPNIAIYVDGKWIRGFRSRDIFTIKTDKGEEIIFQLVKTKGSALLNTLGNNKGVVKPFLKATDGTLTPYGEF